MRDSTQGLPRNWKSRFFTIWTGQAFSLFGSALVQFALIWWLARKGGSATVLTVATLVGMLPQIILGPFAGALVDRWNRRLIMIFADGVIAVSTLLLAYLFWTDQVQLWHIYAIMAFRSLGSAFHQNSMAASTPLLVPDDQLTRVNGLNQTLMGINNLIAPPVGALLIGVLPTQNILLIDIGTALLAILPLLFIDIPQPVKHEESMQTEKPSLLQDIRVAFDYIRGMPGLVAIIFMALFLNFLLTPTGALMPLLITKHFEKGALELGLMESAQGFGIITGGILLSLWGGFKRKTVTSMVGIIALGTSVILIGVAPANLFMMAIAGIFLTGAAIPITNGPINALFQSIIRNDMQGRVMSLVQSAATAIAPLGLIIAGPFSDALGLQVWFWAGGFICILIGIGGFFIPTVMHLDEDKVLSPASN